ncbi:MAG: hypothetical protein K0R67_4003 [Paenibacillus sp.]|jgi:hypothetical protein|nr:hypothetical protein [Paenibacillus sp.]
MNRLFAVSLGEVCPDAREAARLAQERLSEIARVEQEQQQEQQPLVIRLSFRNRQETTGYVLEVNATGDILIEANKIRDYIAGVGSLIERLLAHIDSEAGSPTGGLLPPGRTETVPGIADRIHYMPGHFGNSFEICWTREMRRYLEDLALAGASGYGDWFDPNDMPDPYHSHVFHSTSMFLWGRKKEWLAYSQRLGLDNIIVVTPNIGFVDQMRPEWTGVRNHELRVQGQVLCPSKPESREVILNNQKQLFADLQESGIRIEKIVCAPYDDGGCACELCQPYYPVFLSLVSDVYATISAYYPELKVDICGWWTSDEESALLRSFVNGEAQDWFGSFQVSATYGVFSLPDVRPHIGDMKLGCFLHIGFSHDRRDVYTKTGIHSASKRIQSVLQSFGGQHCLGFMTYNESFGDHYNAFAASQLGWNAHKDVRDITLFYCRLILGLNGQAADQMADLLLDMELLDYGRASIWEEQLGRLKPLVRQHPAQPWAFAHIEAKAELMALDHSIEEALQRDITEALPFMRTRLDKSEQLWRVVYGFGVLRHILIPERMLPDWHKTYLEYEGESSTKANEAIMSVDA